MNEPLIDRDALSWAIQGDVHGDDSGQWPVDRVLAYLRSVLTPEALNVSDAELAAWWLTIGANLHRRIFGEDR